MTSCRSTKAALGTAGSSRRADHDPPDQSDAPPPRRLGGHGVPARQPARRTAPGFVLKELLLLLLRLAVVAAVVLILAQPLLNNQWGRSSAKSRRIRSCSWTTASRCPIAGPIPALLTRPTAWSADWPRRPQPVDAADIHRAALQPGHARQRQADTICSRNASIPVSRNARGRARPACTHRRSSASLTRPSLQPRRVLSDWPAMTSSFMSSRISASAIGKSRARWQKNWRGSARPLRKLYLVNCIDTARPNLAIAALEPRAGTRAARRAGLDRSHGTQFRQFSGRERGGVGL